MVRVGGGWTTLSDFLIRHGGDPDHQILPDELLPLDTKPSSSQPRRRSSSTHTLVIPGNVLGTSSSSHYYHSKTPTPTPDLTALHNSRGSVTPTTAAAYSHQHHPSNRYINSTPVSRRSSISSPEPSIGSSTSGYSSSGNSAKNGPAHTSADTKIPVLRRRQRLPSLQLSQEPFRYRSNSSISISSLPRSTSTILSGPGSGELSFGNSSIPRSNTTLSGRYINYLQSSQHITRRQSNSSLPLNVVASGSTTPVNGASASGTSSAFTTPPKQVAFSAVRKTAQRTF